MRNSKNSTSEYSPRKRKKHEDHENHERWLVSYADFITLLFAFFVVLYATSNADKEKQKRFETSVRASLSIAGVGSLVHEGKPMGGVAEINKALSELAEPLGKIAGKGEDEKSHPDIRHDSLGVHISLAASTVFAPGSSKLRPNSLKILEKVADILKQTKRKIVIEGHTDDIPIEMKEFESNWELAAHRATVVVRYFVKVHGIDPSRLSATSYADQRPLVANTTDESRAQNRRIEIFITNQE